MFAKVKQSFSGKPDGEPVSRAIAVGEVISGDLAAVAVREKWADEVPPNEKAEAPEVEPTRPTPPNNKPRRKGA